MHRLHALFWIVGDIYAAACMMLDGTFWKESIEQPAEERGQPAVVDVD